MLSLLELSIMQGDQTDVICRRVLRWITQRGNPVYPQTPPLKSLGYSGYCMSHVIVGSDFYSRYFFNAQGQWIDSRINNVIQWFRERRYVVRFRLRTTANVRYMYLEYHGFLDPKVI